MHTKMPLQKAWAHTVSLTHGHTDTGRLCGIHIPLFNPSSFENNLASHAHVILTSHICASGHKHNLECSGTHRGSVGYRCLVKVEENSFEYKQRALLGNIVILFHCLRAKLAKHNYRRLMPSLSMALLLSIVLSAALWRLKVGKSQTGHPANDTMRFSTLASFLSIVWGSSADKPDINIQWTQRGVQNDDWRRPVRLCSSTENGRQYKCFVTQYFISSFTI